MIHLDGIEVSVAEKEDAILYVTDDIQTARELRDCGAAVLIYLHEGNRDQDFS